MRIATTDFHHDSKVPSKLGNLHGSCEDVNIFDFDLRKLLAGADAHDLR